MQVTIVDHTLIYQTNGKLNVIDIHETLSNFIFDTSLDLDVTWTFCAWYVAKRRYVSEFKDYGEQNRIWYRHTIPFFSGIQEWNAQCLLFCVILPHFRCGQNAIWMRCSAKEKKESAVIVLHKWRTKKELYFRCTTSRKHSVDREC